MSHLGIARASFVGLSIGGMVGQWLAANAGERVDRLAVLCSAAVVPDPQAFRDRAADVRRRGTAGHLIDVLLPRWFTSDYRSAHPAEMDRIADMVRSIPAEGYAGCAEVLAGADLRPELSRIAAPALVVAGAQDAALPPSCSREIAAAIAGARYVELDPGAHLAPIERSATLNGLLRGLLEL
jgi:3-oxoadipate enol-lactonase